MKTNVSTTYCSILFALLLLGTATGHTEEQPACLAGQVIDATSSLALEGVGVKEIQSGKQARTNADGEFEICLEGGSGVLQEGGLQADESILKWIRSDGRQLQVDATSIGKPAFQLIFGEKNSRTHHSALAPLSKGNSTITLSFTKDGYGKKEVQVNPGTEEASSLVVELQRDDIPGAESRPGPHNTGPSGNLRESESMTITEKGKVVEDFTIQGAVSIKASDVTLRNFRIDATGAHYGIKIESGLSGISLEDGEIFGMNSAAILGMGFTARHLDIHDSGGDGIKAQGSGGPVLVERCYIHHLGKNKGAHADGNQTRGASSPIVYRANNIEMPISDPAPYKTNAAFMLQLEIQSFIIEENWLNGGNYTIYCTPTTQVRNNRFGRDFRYGIRNSCKDWSGNVWDDTGEMTE